MTVEEYRVLYAEATYGEEEREAVNAVLDNPKALVGGSYTSKMEERVAELFGKEYAVMVNSGSSANLLAVEALNLPPGSEVITPLVTFSTTVAPLVQRDLIPVFVDVGVGDYLLDIDQVRDAITDDTRAIMVPSLLGNIPDYRELRRIADKYGLYLIEDSADTLGAKIDGTPTGKYTDISTTSFYGSHVITAFGGGGMICVNDDNWRRRLRKLRGWGRSSAVEEADSIEQRLETNLDGISYDAKFVFDEVGYNFLPLEASAAFGVEQVKKLDAFMKRRQDVFGELYDFFSDHDDQFVLPERDEEVSACWLAFPLTLKADVDFTRADIVKHLEHNGIQTRSLWSGNLLKHPGFEDINCRLPMASYSNANRIMQDAFVIGAHQSMNESQINHIKKTVSEFLDKH